MYYKKNKLNDNESLINSSNSKDCLLSGRMGKFLTINEFKGKNNQGKIQIGKKKIKYKFSKYKIRTILFQLVRLCQKV